MKKRKPRVATLTCLKSHNLLSAEDRIWTWAFLGKLLILLKKTTLEPLKNGVLGERLWKHNSNQEEHHKPRPPWSPWSLRERCAGHRTPSAASSSPPNYPLGNRLWKSGLSVLPTPSESARSTGARKEEGLNSQLPGPHSTRPQGALWPNARTKQSCTGMHSESLQSHGQGYFWKKSAGRTLPPPRFQPSRDLTLSTGVPASLQREAEVISPAMESTRLTDTPPARVEAAASQYSHCSLAPSFEPTLSEYLLAVRHVLDGGERRTGQNRSLLCWSLPSTNTKL